MIWKKRSDPSITSEGASAAPSRVLVTEELSQLVLKDGTAMCEPPLFLAG